MTDTRRAGREVFGPFLVHERVGVGATSAVFRATRKGDGSGLEVGLKRLHSHLCDDERAVRAFLYEAELAAKLEHRNICKFFEVGRCGDEYFIAMEYIDGKSLEQLMERARLRGCPPPLGASLSLICQLCDAIDYAHRRRDGKGVPLGFVHRDLSPANLVIRPDGQLKLIDLGIAKDRTSEDRTETGLIKGTMGYVAPEVLVGGQADRRSDLFAVGVIAWELLTAEHLFTGRTDQETIARVGACVVASPSSRNARCPAILDPIVAHALSRNPARRWPTANAMKVALTAAAATLHEPISQRVVATWIEQTGPMDVVVAEATSNLDTLVRHPEPRTLPMGPRRFPVGTARVRRWVTTRARGSGGGGVEADSPPVLPPSSRNRSVVESRTVRPPAVATRAGAALPRVRPPRVAKRAAVRPGREWSQWIAIVGGAAVTFIAVFAVLGDFGSQRLDRRAPNDRLVLAETKVAGGRVTFPPASIPALPMVAVAPAPIEESASSTESVATPSVSRPTASAAELPEPVESDRKGDRDRASAVGSETGVASAPHPVDATAMHRRAGRYPESRSSRAPYRARLCVDTSGKVTSVEVVDGPERLHRRIARNLAHWRYQPYQAAGRAIPVCFEVSERLRPWRKRSRP